MVKSRWRMVEDGRGWWVMENRVESSREWIRVKVKSGG